MFIAVMGSEINAMFTSIAIDTGINIADGSMKYHFISRLEFRHIAAPDSNRLYAVAESYHSNSLKIIRLVADEGVPLADKRQLDLRLETADKTCLGHVSSACRSGLYTLDCYVSTFEWVGCNAGYSAINVKAGSNTYSCVLNSCLEEY